MYTLYTIPGTCSTGIHVMLNQLDIPVEIVKRDDVENYQALVATNQVPALQTEQGLLTEGSAIVLYLLAKHNVNIEDFSDNHEFNQWLMFNYATLHPSYSKMFTTWQVMEDGEAKQRYLAQLAERVVNMWQIVDRRLADREFIFGDKVSVIDYLLAIYVSWGNVFPQLAIPVGENTLRMVRKVKLLPEFVRAYQKEGGEFNIPANALN